MGNGQKGFSLVELLVALVIAAMLGMVSYPIYTGFAERARVAAAIADLGEIQIAIERYITRENGGYPASLADLDVDDVVDPWGNPYQYLVIEGLNNNGAVRKDKNLVPINSDYDVYSMGRDGRSESPLTSVMGRDDVVRGGNGTYIGPAGDY